MNGHDQRMPSQGRRSLVLGVGILSIALSLAGLGTYAVVQVLSSYAYFLPKGSYFFEGAKPKISVRRISIGKSISQLSGLLVNIHTQRFCVFIFHKLLSTELILIVTLTALGLLVNSLLVFGVHKNRR